LPKVRLHPRLAWKRNRSRRRLVPSI